MQCKISIFSDKEKLIRIVYRVKLAYDLVDHKQVAVKILKT